MAKELNISRSAVVQRIAASPRLQAVVREVKEIILDAVDGNIVKSIHGGDVQTSKWYAERQGIERGYGNKSQVENKLSDGELEAIATAFGGDLKKLKALQAAVNAAKTGQS